MNKAPFLYVLPSTNPLLSFYYTIQNDENINAQQMPLNEILPPPPPPSSQLKPGFKRPDIAELRAEIHTLHAKLAANEQEFVSEKAAMKEELLQMTANLAHREKKLHAVQAEAQQQIHRAITEAEGRVVVGAASTEEVEKAKAATAVAQAETEKVKRQLEERRAAVKAGDIRAAQLESRVISLQKKLSLAENASQGQDGVTLDLENQLSATENELRMLKTTSEDAISYAASLEARVVELEASNDELASASISKDWRIEDLVLQVNDLREAMKDAQTEADSARAAMEATRGYLADLAAQRTEDIESSLKMLRSLEEEVSAVKSAASRKEMALKAAEEELVVLRSGKAGSDNGAAALATELAAMRSKAVQLEAALTKSQTIGASEKAVVEEMERRVVEAEGRVAAAQAARATATAELSTLRAALDERDSTIVSLMQVIDEIGASETEMAAQMEEKIQNLEAAVADSVSDLQSKEWRIDDLVAQIKELRDVSAEDMEMALQERSAAEQVHQAALVEQREILEAQRQATIEKMKGERQVATEKMNEERLSEVKLAEVKLSELQQAVDEAEERVEQLQQDLVAAKDLGKKRSVEVRQLTEERAILMKTVHELQHAFKENEDEHVDAVARLQATEMELSVAQGKIAATEKLISKLAATKMTHHGGKENGSGNKAMAAGKEGVALRANPLRPLSANAIH